MWGTTSGRVGLLVVVWVCAMWMAIASTGCARDSSAPGETVAQSAATLVSVAVTPPKRKIHVGTRLAFYATGTFSDGRTSRRRRP